MADTAGVPDTIMARAALEAVREDVATSLKRTTGLGAAGLAVELNANESSNASANGLNLNGPSNRSRGGQASGSAVGSNGIVTLSVAGAPPVELFRIEPLPNPKSTFGTTRSKKTGSRRERAGGPRPATTRPASPTDEVDPFCEWCRQPMGPRKQSGRRRVYCSQSCRQRAYQSRRRSKQLGLRAGELVVSSVLLDRMNKRLKDLELALVRVESAELHLTDERIAELCRAARRLRRQVVGPPTR
jgi:hypothetical protein